MRLLTHAVLFLTMFAIAPSVPAQDLSSIYGRLTMVDRRGPVAGAVVRLIDESERTITLISDDKGRFARVGIRPGRYRATIERDGFAAVDVIGIDVRSSDRLRLYVELTPFDEAPFRRQTIRYSRPMVNIENATITTRVL